jgi:hypothetical protein
MPHRILSNRRAQEIVNFEQGGYQYRIAVSRFEDGTPAEVLIDSAKPGSTLDTYAQDVATLLSLLMQNGVDLSRIERRLSFAA